MVPYRRNDTRAFDASLSLRITPFGTATRPPGSRHGVRLLLAHPLRLQIRHRW